MTLIALAIRTVNGYNHPALLAKGPFPLTQEGCMGAMKEFAGVYYREGALDP